MSLKSKSLFALSPMINDLLVQERFLSTSKPLYAYSDTVSNLQIGEHTRVIFQGFTGRQVNFIPKLIHCRTSSKTDSRRLKTLDNQSSMGQKLSVVSRLAKTQSTLDFPCGLLCEQ